MRGDASPKAEDAATSNDDRRLYHPWFVNGPYHASEKDSPTTVFPRDPRTGVQVWSGDSGYPGDSHYLDFHKKLREAYLDLAEREPARCVPVDASGDPQSVANAVWAVVSVRLNPQQAPAMDAAS